MRIKLEILGELITVREFRRGEREAIFVEAGPLLAELRAMFIENNGPPPLILILAIIDQYPDAWSALLARSTGRKREWIAELSDTDAQRLTLAFLAAGTRFWRLVGAAGQVILEA